MKPKPADSSEAQPLGGLVMKPGQRPGKDRSGLSQKGRRREAPCDLIMSVPLGEAGREDGGRRVLTDELPGNVGAMLSELERILG